MGVAGTEKEPSHTLTARADDLLRLRVVLPGVESASEVRTTVSAGDRSVTICVPGRYRLVRHLDVLVSQNLEELRFLSRGPTLQVLLRVIGTPAAVAAENAGDEQQAAEQQAAAAAAAAEEDQRAKQAAAEAAKVAAEEDCQRTQAAAAKAAEAAATERHQRAAAAALAKSEEEECKRKAAADAAEQRRAADEAAADKAAAEEEARRTDTGARAEKRRVAAAARAEEADRRRRAARETADQRRAAEAENARRDKAVKDAAREKPRRADAAAAELRQQEAERRAQEERAQLHAATVAAAEKQEADRLLREAARGERQRAAKAAADAAAAELAREPEQAQQERREASREQKGASGEPGDPGAEDAHARRAAAEEAAKRAALHERMAGRAVAERRAKEREAARAAEAEAAEARRVQEEREEDEKRRAEERQKAWRDAGRPWPQLWVLGQLAMILGLGAYLALRGLCRWLVAYVPLLLPVLVQLAGARKLAARLEESVARGGRVVSCVSWPLAVVVGGPLALGVAAVALSVVLVPCAFLFRLVLWRPRWWTALLSCAVSLYVGKRSALLAPLPMFPLLWWLSGGGWLALLATPAVVFGILCDELRFSFLAWAAVAMLRIVMSRWSSAAPMRKDTQDVPAGANGEVRRVLEADTHYAVLEVAQDADRATIKAAWRAKSLLTHPDKVGAHTAGANEAVSAVKNAYDVLLNESLRAAYNRQLRVLAQERAEAAAAAARARARPQPAQEASYGGLPQVGEREWAVLCPICGAYHVLVATRRRKAQARFCSECRTYHQAEQLHVWAETESTGFWRTGLRIYTYTHGLVVDITSLNCHGLYTDMPANAHITSMRFSQAPFRVPEHLRPNGYTAAPSQPDPPAGSGSGIGRSSKKNKGKNRRR
ncbi:hypothetical protein WJX81_006052 [Elliptochloris bilobata]|uniref:J domain-containing protein n=1 Tax=Elliptochloris bilobata TaxID=381761 RepID=A0AAW1S5N7_9CHLO